MAAEREQPPQAPEVSEQEVGQAVTEGAGEATTEGQAPETMVQLPPSGVEAPAGQDPSAPPAPSGPGEEGPSPADKASDAFAEHPEYFVGGAFAAGLVVAQILRRLGE